MKPIVGQAAPLFKKTDSDGQLIDLNALRGKKIVLYFYPKDDTPGCTAQACNLNENLDKLQADGFVVIGVSIDSDAAHTKFKKKYQLNFSLIADTDHALVEAYGVWGEKSMYGKTYMGTARTTFIINEEGIISNVIEKVDTKNHTSQIH
jgi:thioredoxin-dependent peroxiredoxin